MAAGLNREKLGAYTPEEDFKPGFEEKILKKKIPITCKTKSADSFLTFSYFK